MRGFNDLDRLFAHRLFFDWRFRRLWESRLNFQRVGDDRRRFNRGFSQGNRLIDRERHLFRLALHRWTSLQTQR